MLCLSRKSQQRFTIGESVVTILKIHGDKVRVGIEAPRNIPILREELATAELRRRMAGNEPLHQIEADLDYREAAAKARTTNVIPAASLPDSRR